MVQTRSKTRGIKKEKPSPKKKQNNGKNSKKDVGNLNYIYFNFGSSEPLMADVKEKPEQDLHVSLKTNANIKEEFQQDLCVLIEKEKGFENK